MSYINMIGQDNQNNAPTFSVLWEDLVDVAILNFSGANLEEQRASMVGIQAALG